MRALIAAMILSVGLISCAPSDPRSFHVSETARHTKIVVRDVDGRELGRVELQHGPIVLGEEYGELAGTIAEGRQLNVKVDGQTFEWQTVGFDDTTHMPALPPAYFDAVAALVGDEHVAPTLRRWNIGWEPRAAGHGDSLDECIYSGSSATVYNFGGQPGSYALQKGRTLACNGGPAWQGLALFQETEDHVMQCCGSTASVGRYAEKTCAHEGTCIGGAQDGAVCKVAVDCPGGSCANFSSSCGASGMARCKPCFDPIPYVGFCAVGSSEYVVFGQPPHHFDDKAAHERQFYGCRTFGDQCLETGVNGDCFGEGWGEGAAPECCTGLCHDYHCTGP
jgi:hypothetical protein